MTSKIIIVRNSEVLPSDKGGRLWRSGMYAKYFLSEGKKVDWVVSSFDHYNKLQRTREYIGEDVVMLNSPGYRANVSIARIIDHLIFSIKLFWYLCKQKNVEFILCSYPTPESSFMSVLVGKIKKIPVVIDIRDLWPDVFLDTTSSKFFNIKRFLLSPYNFMLKFSMRNASIVMAVNKEFLSWGQKYRKEESKKNDFISFIPFEEPEVTPNDKEIASKILKDSKFDDNSLLIVFGGTIGSMFEFDTLLEALKISKENDFKVNVLICGNGESLDFWKRKFEGLNNVYFSGRVKANVLFALLAKADLLFACYKNISGFYGHLPNKFMEYCSAGKPIVNGLKGYAADLIDDYNSGMNYNNANELYEIFNFYSQKENLTIHSTNARLLYEKKFHPDVIFSDLKKNLRQFYTEEKI